MENSNVFTPDRFGELDRNLVWQLRRILQGRIEFKRTVWASQTTAKALDFMASNGLATVSSSPKGQKQYYNATPAAEALRPLVVQWERDRDESLEQERQRQHAEEVLHKAAPELYAALVELLDTVETEHGKSPCGYYAPAMDKARQALALANPRGDKT